MGADKKILVTIPADLNKKLEMHLVNIRYEGESITKVDLILKLVEIGLKLDQIGKIKTVSDVAPKIRDDAPGLNKLKT